MSFSRNNPAVLSAPTVLLSNAGLVVSKYNAMISSQNSHIILVGSLDFECFGIQIRDMKIKLYIF